MWIPKCVGCGYCCLKAPCSISVGLFGKDKCPALNWSEKKGRYICLLVIDPSYKGDAYKKDLAIGEGCSSSLNTWRKDVKKRDEEQVNG